MTGDELFPGDGGSAAAFDEGMAAMADLYEWPGELGEDLQLLMVTPIYTSRYQRFRPAQGVPVRITVRPPRYWRADQLAGLAECLDLAPWERAFWNNTLDDSQQARLYEARCEDHLAQVVRQLAFLARLHPGQPLVLLCFEDVLKGEGCHRRWFADWFQRRFGIEVPELVPSA